ncbi:hypothetical protein [Haloferula sp.]|uniref:hypothetical protein n=1 Tax=Haloferula sp. TaxID=2497595 RepID=UPI003C719C7C
MKHASVQRIGKCLSGALVALSAFCLSSCVTEETVTDGSGQVIYQEPVVHTPFESEQKKQEQTEQRERELGW